MKRPIHTVRRSFSVVAALALVASALALQISGAHAAAMTVTKTVCVYTTGSCAATPGGAVNAVTGDVLQYTISFAGVTAGNTATVTDQIAAGQTAMNCVVPTGATCTSSTNSSTGVTTITFTFTNVGSAGSGTATLTAKVTATSGTISNTASATQTTPAFDATACAALGTGYSVSGSNCAVAPTSTSQCPALSSAQNTALGNAGFTQATVVSPSSAGGTCTYDFVIPAGGTVSAAQAAVAQTVCQALGGTQLVYGGVQANCTGVPATRQTCPSGFTLGGTASTTVCVRALAAAVTSTAITSAATVVTITSVPTVPVTVPTGNVVLCGQVQAFTAGSVLTISGVTFNMTGGTVITGSPIVISGNVCSNITVNVNNQITNIFVYPNQTQVSYMCTAVGTNNQNCVLINASGATTGTLSLLPIAAHAEGLTGGYRSGSGWAS